MTRRLLALVAPLTLVLAVPASASAAKELKTNPVKEFLLTPWIPIHLGPLDLSITKAVVYLLIAAVVAVGSTLLIIRGGLKLRPGRSQAVAEMVYDFAESQIGKAALPPKVFSTWFPYIATLFVFIWVNNLISFLPLPLNTEHKVWGIPTPGFYAATSNISVTLALTLVTFFASHYVGVKHNGFVGYIKSWFPPIKGPINLLIVPLEILSQLLRLVSLSVRLFANMLAGHLLVIMCISLIVIIGNVFVAAISIPIGAAFFVFEVTLVASLQAFIFALLSGIYIGGAAEPHH